MFDLRICPDKGALGQAAATAGAETIRAALQTRGEATIVVATGASQFEMLQALTAMPNIAWDRVTAFHLDEYVGLPVTHPASFRGYLRQRFLAPLGGRPTLVEVDGEAADPAAEAARLSSLIDGRTVDVCFAGFGENCHLAFNDPPADFDAPSAYIVVELDEACRRQQLGEGWFPSLEAVPRHAISMSIPRIMQSALVVLSVPDARKAAAVRDAVQGPVTPLHPGSILQRHPKALLFVDPSAASLLRQP
ncbi:glucosamine-6-phosphate deaminase [Roseomonas nepalensis]|uniref:Glucosamine-6-phosphate deaminase n=1 Tax=Muricoccus nepalensis TaxID=1854500 RepID=A0A502F9G4_9PROT|nr:glucosamine-6-phosphate deaminase [Roseomonas nepalensis]TPG46042.1 glucosamine-6-phosphate deaminase [Roseomonas nepalensis]